jgi:hypothetical protein
MLKEYQQKMRELESRAYGILEKHLKEIDEEKINQLKDEFN